MFILGYFEEFWGKDLLEHHLSRLRINFQEGLGDSCMQGDGLFVGLCVFVVYFEDFVEEGEELLVINEVVVDVLDNEIDLAGLLEELEEPVESFRSDLGAALVVFFLASTEDLDDVVDARVVFLLDLDAELLEVVCNGLLLDQQNRRFSQEVQYSLALTELAVLSLRFLGGGRIEALEFNFPDFDLRLVISKRTCPLLDLILLPSHFLLDLIFPLIDQPLNEPCIVLLCVNHVLLHGHVHDGAGLLLLQINHSVQFPILGCVTSCRLLVEWLFRGREGAGQTTVDVQFLACA